MMSGSERRPRGTLFATALAALALAALAGPPGGILAAPQGPGPGGPRGLPAEEAEDLVETLEIYMIAKMKRALDLSPEQQERVIPLIEDLSASRRAFNHERRLVLMRLRPLVEDPQASDAEIRESLARMDRAESEFKEKERRSLEAIRSALTPRQEAKFILFRERFRREIQERLQRLRREMHGIGGREIQERHQRLRQEMRGIGGPGPERSRRPEDRPGAYRR